LTALTPSGEAPHPPVDSVRRRFAVTLLVNLFKLAVGVLTASIVPRALGPRDYGSFQFLTTTAGTIRSFLDLGASTAAYTYNAQHRQSGLAALLYGRWLLIQLAVIALAILAADRLGLTPRIWPDQRVLYVLLITGLEWLTFVGTFLLQLGDSKAETVLVQRINLLGQLVRVTVLLVLYVLGALDLGTFVAASYAAAGFTVVAVLIGFVRARRARYFRTDFAPADRRRCLEFFVSYGRPLVVLSLAILVHDFFDRWFLQTVSGSVQQGYFALGVQWSAISLVFTTSALNIVWRESAVASAAKDVARMQSLFRRTTRLFFFVASAIACLVAFNARAFVHGLAGPQYASAQPVMVLLAFYPVHQTLGQINGVFYYATERVALYRNLTVGALAAGVLASYVLLAPTTASIPGMQLGALGLALKQVAVNIISVSVLHTFNARFVQLSPWRELGSQFGTIVVVGGCSALAFFVVHRIGAESPWTRLLAMALLQVALLGVATYSRPGIAGVSRDELLGYAARVRGALRHWFGARDAA